MSRAGTERRGARILARAALLLASLGLVAGGAELALRGLPREPESPPPRSGEPPEPGLPVLKGIHSIVGPNIRGIRSGAYFRTNEHGVRGPSIPLRTPPGVFRIGVAGDSVTMGGGVLEEEAYPALLGDLLEPALGRRVQVLNFGLGGLNATQVVARLAQLGRLYEPDLIVYGYTLNDIQGEGYVELSSNEEKLAASRQAARWRHSRSALLAFALPRLASLRTWLWPDSNPMTREYFYNYFENPAAWGRVEKALDRFAGMAMWRGVCPQLFLHTQVAELSLLHPVTPLYDRVETAARRRGIATTRSFPAFRGRRARDFWVGPFDPHPNPEGHRLLAGALAKGLLELPDYCWEPSATRKPAVRARMARSAEPGP